MGSTPRDESRAVAGEMKHKIKQPALAKNSGSTKDASSLTLQELSWGQSQVTACAGGCKAHVYSSLARGRLYSGVRERAQWDVLGCVAVCAISDSSGCFPVLWSRRSLLGAEMVGSCPQKAQVFLRQHERVDRPRIWAPSLFGGLGSERRDETH